MYVDYLKDRIDRVRKDVAEWASDLAREIRPAYFVSMLEGSEKAFELSTELEVMEYVYEAFIKEGSIVTLQSALEYCTTKAIDYGQYPRRSSSRTGNLVHLYQGAAWAVLAKELQGWAGAKTRPDVEVDPEIAPYLQPPPGGSPTEAEKADILADVNWSDGE